VSPLLLAVDINAPRVDWLAILPVVVLGGTGIAIVLLRSIARRRGEWISPASLAVAIAGTLATGAVLVVQWVKVDNEGARSTLAEMVRLDTTGIFLAGVVVIATLFVLLLSADYLRREGLEAPEYLALLLLSAMGMLVMTAANDLIVVFLALEILSIPLYVLAAFDRRRLGSQEAGIKYFVLGAFSSAVFLYGAALVYGATGTTSLTGIDGFLAGNVLLEDGTLLAGIALVLVGIGFKIAVAPFHMWTPDVYQGAPTPVTGFMASATKVAGFAALIRVFLVAFPLFRDTWRPALGILAILTLAVGSIAALVQTDVKRMLAYSSIAHAGYVLIGVTAAAGDGTEVAERGIQAALLYLLVYAFMTIGAFAVVMVVARPSHDARHTLDDYHLLANRSPVLAGMLAFFLLAQAGVPLTGGFIAKLEVFSAATEAGAYYLVIAGVVAAVIAAYIYLRIVVTMFAGEELPTEPGPARHRIDPAAALVLTVSAAAVLAIGIAPAWFLDLARDAAVQL
jgi:NADH-quinone oxidoreductase subunit N